LGTLFLLSIFASASAPVPAGLLLFEASNVDTTVRRQRDYNGQNTETTET
jgi:hypothetical protein